MSDRSMTLRKLAPILDSLKPDPDARLTYELMSDALIWSDELPPVSDDYDTNCLRGIFRYRTTLILGKPEEKFRARWEEARTLFPHWPGFLPERQVSDPERIRYYEEAEARLIAQWEALNAEYERRKAEKGKQPGMAV